MAEGEIVGYKRILHLPPNAFRKLRFVIDDARAAPALQNLSLYYAPDLHLLPDPAF